MTRYASHRFKLWQSANLSRRSAPLRRAWLIQHTWMQACRARGRWVPRLHDLGAF